LLKKYCFELDLSHCGDYLYKNTVDKIIELGTSVKKLNLPYLLKGANALLTGLSIHQKLTSCYIRRTLVEDSTMALLLEKCSSLTALDVSWCDKLTNNTLNQIGKYCTSLRTLRLACTVFNDASLNSLQPCKLLEELSLGGCSYITDNAFLLLRGFPNIDHLVLMNTEITYPTLATLLPCLRLRTMLDLRGVKLTKDEIATLMALLPDRRCRITAYITPDDKK